MQTKQLKTPLVSVIMPIYNRKDLLIKALESVINQTYKNLEIIISDNYSTDGTEEVCREYAQKDKRIKYFRQEKNIGSLPNGNFCWKQVTGEYVFAVCDDDWVDLDYAEKTINFAINNPEYSAVMPATILYNEDYSVFKQHAPVDMIGNVFERVETFILQNCTQDAVSGLWKTEVLKQMYMSDGVCLKFRYAEDHTIAIKLAVAGKIKILNDTFYHKLNNGTTRKLETTTTEFYNVNGLTDDNFFYVLATLISRAVLTDKYFDLYLNKKEKKEMAKMVKKSYLGYNRYIKFHYDKQATKDIVESIKTYPLTFLFKKDFYLSIKKVLRYYKNIIRVRSSAWWYCFRERVKGYKHLN